MGCSYTGSAGGAIVIDTPNCANAAADMASIRSARDSKRILRILNHLASSSFDCPVVPCCCGLRGWNGGASMQGFHGGTAKSVHYSSLFRECSHLNLLNDFPEITVPASKKAARAQTADPRR